MAHDTSTSRRPQGPIIDVEYAPRSVRLLFGVPPHVTFGGNHHVEKPSPITVLTPPPQRTRPGLDYSVPIIPGRLRIAVIALRVKVAQVRADRAAASIRARNLRALKRISEQFSCRRRSIAEDRPRRHRTVLADAAGANCHRRRTAHTHSPVTRQQSRIRRRVRRSSNRSVRGSRGLIYSR